MSFSRSKHSEPKKEQKSKCPAGAENTPTNRFLIHEKTLPACHKLTCSIWCCCWSTRSCQWLRADAMFLLSWSCDCWFYSFKIKAPRATSIFWFHFFQCHSFFACILRKRLFNCVSPGTFLRSARCLPHPAVATHLSWSPCWHLRIFIVTGEVLKGNCTAFRATFKPTACMMGAAEKTPTASSWQPSITQV